MNPEFRRNLWLELTPRRMTLMVVILALAFFAAALTQNLVTHLPLNRKTIRVAAIPLAASLCNHLTSPRKSL